MLSVELMLCLFLSHIIERFQIVTAYLAIIVRLNVMVRMLGGNPAESLS